MTDLQEQYTELYGKKPAAAYKNNEEWLRNKIDLALENGTEELPPKTASQERREKACKECKDTPADVLVLAKSLEVQDLIGKFYSGEWEIYIETKGTSFKKL